MKTKCPHCGYCDKCGRADTYPYVRPCYPHPHYYPHPNQQVGLPYPLGTRWYSSTDVQSGNITSQVSLSI